MKFDYIIGNPPYQETLGGTKNVDIWPAFVMSVVNMANGCCLIHPGRWVIPKKQMQKTHDMLLSSGMVSFDLIPDSSDVFPNIRGVDGGLTITCFRHNYSGDIYYCIDGEFVGLYDEKSKFFSNKYEREAYNKIFTVFPNCQTMQSRVLGSIGSLGSTEFGYEKNKHLPLLVSDKNKLNDPISVWAAIGYGKGTRYTWRFIEKDLLNHIPDKVLSSRKILVSKVGVAITNKKAVGINGIPQILDKNAIGENVFLIFPENDTDYELMLLKTLFMTKTARFLMSITQKDLYVRGFENIPDYMNFVSMLGGKYFTDAFFYKTFHFSPELISYIESHVSEKTDS